MNDQVDQMVTPGSQAAPEIVQGKAEIRQGSLNCMATKRRDAQQAVSQRIPGEVLKVDILIRYDIDDIVILPYAVETV